MHRGLGSRRAWLLLAVAAMLLVPTAAVAQTTDPHLPGPPFPEPEPNRAVYDFAGVFRQDTVHAVEATIDAIEARTGAEVAVLTQVWPYQLSESETESNARALMDQWGVGRRGFDDGLVILFDLDPSLIHGQVQLYAGSGFRATFLTDEERQQIFEDDMLPLLRRADLDGALLVAMERIDAAATPEHARTLEVARQVNAVVGLVGGSVALLGLVGFAIFSWLRFGRDPIYHDDESVHVPAPPEGMTPAVATLVNDGWVSRRTLTTALLDLASRGRVAFREEKGLLGFGRPKLSIDLGAKAREAATADITADEIGLTPAADEAQRRRIAESRLSLVERRPLSRAEEYLETRLTSIAEDDSIDADDVPLLAEDVPVFERRVEEQAVRNKWFARRPSEVVGRWRMIAVGEGVAAGLLIFAGFNLPASGLTLLGAACAVAAVVTLILAGAQPARTMDGAMQRSWLAAYRRTLKKTMDQARSMDQVVAEAKLDWLETPDQAVVWATALGLTGEVEDVLARTMEDSRETGHRVGYLPNWYRGEGGMSMASGIGGGGGLFSSSGVPSIGGMMAAMSTIGNAPSSSGSGDSGGGGFSGGGGGGGGGAGGGF